MPVRIVIWVLIIFWMLFIPYGTLLIVFGAIVLFVLKKINSFILLLTLIASSLVQNSLVNMENFAFARFLLVPFILIPTNIKLFYDIAKNYPLFLVFIFYLIFNAIFISYYPLYSILESVPFALMILVSYAGTKQLSSSSMNIYHLESLYIAIIITSILVLPFPSISYARNDVGFQGSLTHPNIFAVMLAPYFGMLLFRYIRERKRMYLLGMITVLVLLIMSQSRTSIFAIIIGIIIVFFIKKTYRQYIFKALRVSIIPLLLLTVIFYSSIINGINSFLTKSGNADTFQESIELSRGQLFISQIDNISQHLLFGIGFKVPSNLETRTALGSTNEGNYYEKGNMLLVIIEELGFIGFMLFSFFIAHVVLSNSCARLYSNEYIIVPIIALITTLGEASMFSIGGVGMLVWTFIFLNHCSFKTKSK